MSEPPGVDMPSLVVAWLMFTVLAVICAAHCARPLIYELRRWLRTHT